jgi:hypothetical protein
LLTDEHTNKSDELLDALLRLRTAEQDLRHLRISSEEFHRLAEEVDVLRDELSALARAAPVNGNRTTGTSDGRTRGGREVSERPTPHPTGVALSGLG